MLSRLDDLEGPSLAEGLTISFWNRPTVEKGPEWQEEIAGQEEREV